MKKFLSIILAVCLIVTMNETAVFAHDVTNDYESMEVRKERVLKEYKEKIREIEENAITKKYVGNEKSTFELKLDVQADTVSALKEIGYDAYDVNPQTFERVEATLKTDLAEAGLREEGAYIITLNEENFADSRAVIDDPFSHTYNGTTYTIRYMTVRVTDDPRLQKTSSENLAGPNATTQLILNAIDTGIYVAIDALSPFTAFLGTIGSILGISVSDLLPDGTTTFRLHAATEWTQGFTQVWNNIDQVWVFGSCVEVAELRSTLDGYYYDVNTYNHEFKVESNTQLKWSSHFHDIEWRKNYAVIGYLNSWIQWDVTGNATYSFGERIMITHTRNF